MILILALSSKLVQNNVEYCKSQDEPFYMVWFGLHRSLNLATPARRKRRKKRKHRRSQRLLRETIWNPVDCNQFCSGNPWNPWGNHPLCSYIYCRYLDAPCSSFCFLAGCRDRGSEEFKAWGSSFTGFCRNIDSRAFQQACAKQWGVSHKMNLSTWFGMVCVDLSMLGHTRQKKETEEAEAPKESEAVAWNHMKPCWLQPVLFMWSLIPLRQPPPIFIHLLYLDDLCSSFLHSGRLPRPGKRRVQSPRKQLHRLLRKHW